MAYFNQCASCGDRLDPNERHVCDKSRRNKGSGASKQKPKTVPKKFVICFDSAGIPYAREAKWYETPAI